MAGYFTGGSITYISNPTPPITAAPLTVGVWINMETVSTLDRTWWMLTDTGTINNYFSLNLSPSEEPQLIARAGGTEAIATGLVIPVNKWVFVLGRCVTATDRHLSQLVMGTSTFISHASNTTSMVPAGIDTHIIGARQTSTGVGDAWNGAIAEFWLANTDVGNAGTATPNSLVHQLAFGGPFSVPRIGASIVEYRSFRFGLTGDRDRIGDVYYGAINRPVWTATNGPQIASSHPPLPYWYVRPGQVKTQLII